MAEPHTHAAGLRAQCGFGAFCKPGHFLDRGPRLRMRAQFFLFSFGVFTANALLDLLSHDMLLIWEGALLTSCYNLSIIKLARYNAYGRAYSFATARAALEVVWREYLSRRTPSDFQTWRDQQAWTTEKYRRFDRGEWMPHDWRTGV
jgi:hypothetical protein